jgi:CHASE1-domain containing sensor protein
MIPLLTFICGLLLGIAIGAALVERAQQRQSEIHRGPWRGER